VLLYQAVGIQVPVHATVGTQYQTDGDFPTATIDTYLPDGAHGSSGRDADLDGVAEFVTRWQYDALGRITRSEDGSDLPAPHPAYVDTFDYDMRGALTGGDGTDTRDDGVLIQHNEFTADVDDFCFDTTTLGETDSQGDGVVDVRIAITWRYDDRHRSTGYVRELDSDGDGVVDERDAETQEFDASGRQTGGLHETDADADGTIDSRAEASADYSVPRTTRIETMLDDDADGQADARIFIVSQYDLAGNEIAHSEDSDPNADGVIDLHWEWQATYDAERRLLTRTAIDSGLRSELTCAYDSTGNLRTYSLVSDYGSSGILHMHQDQEWEYGSSGEPLGMHRYDYITGGHYSTIASTLTVHHELRADGVLLLAQSYLEP
jgi:serralysin